MIECPQCRNEVFPDKDRQGYTIYKCEACDWEQCMESLFDNPEDCEEDDNLDDDL